VWWFDVGLMSAATLDFEILYLGTSQNLAEVGRLLLLTSGKKTSKLTKGLTLKDFTFPSRAVAS